MENAARKVRESNREADEKYFEALRRECEVVKAKSVDGLDTQK